MTDVVRDEGIGGETHLTVAVAHEMVVNVEPVHLVAVQELAPARVHLDTPAEEITTGIKRDECSWLLTNGLEI